MFQLEKFKAERLGRLSQVSDDDSFRVSMSRQYIDPQGVSVS